MRRHVPFLFVATVFFLLTPAISSAQQDARGSKDHPLFSRWPGYYIYYYEHKNFDAYGFRLKDRKEKLRANSPDVAIFPMGSAPDYEYYIRYYVAVIGCGEEEIIGGLTYSKDTCYWIIGTLYSKDACDVACRHPRI